MTTFTPSHIGNEQKTRYQLLGLFKSLVTYFSQSKELPMRGSLKLNYGDNRCVFDLTVFSPWHRESNRWFSFYVFKDYEKQKLLSQKVIKAIELDDFEKIIELSEHDTRTSVQKYIDRQAPYTCHECGRKQHDPFNRVEVMSESDFTILGGCDDCNNRIIQDMHDLDQEVMA